MREYFVDYRQFFGAWVGDGDEVYEDTMSFQADDSDHALEQCEDALGMGNAEFEILAVYVN